MDFKIAGTQNGITGIQLDLKIHGISEEIIRATLAQSREARMEILRSMLTTIQRPRREVSEHAPRLITVKIDPEKIGLLIGPGGKTIRGIQESTGAVIEVDDDDSHQSFHGVRVNAANSPEPRNGIVSELLVLRTSRDLAKGFNDLGVSFADRDQSLCGVVSDLLFIVAQRLNQCLYNLGRCLIGNR